MLGSGLLFFFGLLTILLIYALVRHLHPNRKWLEFWQEWSVVFALSIGTMLLIAAIVIGSVITEPWYNTRMLATLSWMGSGVGEQLAAGLIAGVVLAFFLDWWAHYPKQPGSVPTIAAAAAPAATILVLFLISDPRLRANLTGVELGGAKFSFANVPAASTYPSAFVLTSPGVPNPNDPFASGSRDQIIYLSNPDRATKDGSLAGTSYYLREQVIMQVIDSVDPLADANAAHPHYGIIQAIRYQKALLQDLRPVVQCAFYYRSLFPNSLHLESTFEPIMQSLTTLEVLIRKEEALRFAAPSPNRRSQAQIEHDFRTINQKLSEQISTLQTELYRRIPEAHRLTDRDPSRWLKILDCVPSLEVHSETRPLVPGASLSRPAHPNQPHMAPYLAVFIAYVHGALGNPQPGLQLLDEWLRQYEHQMRQVPESYLIWPYHRAIMDFNALQSSTAPPYNRTFRRSLAQYVQATEAHWAPHVGRRHGECKADTWPEPTMKDADRLRAEAVDRLALVADSALGELLIAVIDTLSREEKVTVELAGKARQLIQHGRQCLKSEAPNIRMSRSARSLLAGGRLLAYWAVDGHRDGLLSGAMAQNVRLEARGVLLESLPQLRHLERVDDEEAGSLRRIGSNPFEPYRRMAERELALLEAQLDR